MTEAGIEMRVPGVLGEIAGDEVRRLDRASARPLPYPYRHQHPYWHRQEFNASRMRYTLPGAGL